MPNILHQTSNHTLLSSLSAQLRALKIYSRVLSFTFHTELQIGRAGGRGFLGAVILRHESFLHPKGDYYRTSCAQVLPNLLPLLQAAGLE